MQVQVVQLVDLAPIETETAATDDSDAVDSDANSDPKVPIQVVSSLNRLKSPTSADLAKSRKSKNSRPPKGKRRCKGTLVSDPKNVAPSQRVREFSEELFTVFNCPVFCTACREHISLKRNVITFHTKSAKHKKSKERLQHKVAREKHIADTLVRQNEETHLRGETLPEQQQVYCIKVVSCFLKGGVPLSKIDAFRELLEENAYRLTDRRNMQDNVPFILKDEESRMC